MPVTHDQLDWGVETLKTFGVPIAMLAVIVYGIWRVISWSGKNVVTPLVERQVALMDAIQKAQENQSTVLCDIKGVIVESRETNRQNQHMLQQLLGVK